jgi:hypothetical protein
MPFKWSNLATNHLLSILYKGHGHADTIRAMKEGIAIGKLAKEDTRDSEKWLKENAVKLPGQL